MNLQDLKKEIPFRWRVQQFSKHKPSASCVAYIDARDAMNLLDDVCGAENWASDYREVAGRLFAGVGINVDGKSWVWKWDTGAETNVEAEKGEASDSFKRACVKWGVGRFLYGLDVVYVDTNTPKANGVFPYVVDGNKRVWDLTSFINNKRSATSKSSDNSNSTSPVADVKRITKAQQSEITELVSKLNLPKDREEKVLAFANDTLTLMDKAEELIKRLKSALPKESETKQTPKEKLVDELIAKAVEKWKDEEEYCVSNLLMSAGVSALSDLKMKEIRDMIAGIDSGKIMPF